MITTRLINASMPVMEPSRAPACTLGERPVSLRYSNTAPSPATSHQIGDSTFTTGIIVVSMIPSDIRNATRKAIGLLKLTGNCAGSATAGVEGKDDGGTTTCSSAPASSKVGFPHI